MRNINMVLPQFGMGMQDAEVVRWLKAVGDRVTEGEPIVEVEAAKTTVEVDCPVTGTLKEICAQPEEVVEVRGKLAVISTD